mmetsp:Transcript_41606/g.97400  ORF Transcript_41606/g.97400 Transcript_41606/m.97400 type:complete len:287 (-) Transcript_41606:798-1658(-)
MFRGHGSLFFRRYGNRPSPRSIHDKRKGTDGGAGNETLQGGIPPRQRRRTPQRPAGILAAQDPQTRAGGAPGRDLPPGRTGPLPRDQHGGVHAHRIALRRAQRHGHGPGYQPRPPPPGPQDDRRPRRRPRRAPLSRRPRPGAQQDRAPAPRRRRPCGPGGLFPAAGGGTPRRPPPGAARGTPPRAPDPAVRRVRRRPRRGSGRGPAEAAARGNRAEDCAGALRSRPQPAAALRDLQRVAQEDRRAQPGVSGRHLHRRRLQRGLRQRLSGMRGGGRARERCGTVWKP